MEIKDRIKQIIEVLGVKTASFEKAIGVANSYLRNVKNVSAETCKSIVEVYPQISLDWLITGNGEMFCQETPAQPSISVHDVTNGGMVTQGNQSPILKFEIDKELVEDFDIEDNVVCKKHYKRLKSLLEKANREIARLEGKVEEQDKFIKMLLDRK